MADLAGRTLFITGASRGIGKAIALRAAVDGANVAVAAKTVSAHTRLPGTIHTAAEEIERAGGRALAVEVDVRDEEQIAAAVEATSRAFGGIDILVNNAGAISLTSTPQTPLKRFDLMLDVNVRGAFACSRACLPLLRNRHNPHILMISPPLNVQSRWFAGHGPYTVSKYAMSMLALGMAEEFRTGGIAVNALWPRTLIATAATRMLGGEALLRHCRRPEIMADAAWLILTRDASSCSGNFFIDEEVLAQAGIGDLDRYAVEPGFEPRKDLFID
jgi:citronellol/citronellal dehydrogenase